MVSFFVITMLPIQLLRLIVHAEKHHPTFSSRSQQLLEIIRRLSQDPSRDVRAFIARLLVSELPPTTADKDTPPPLLYAIFSRPPPKPPRKDDVVEGMKELGIPEEATLELLDSSMDDVPVGENGVDDEGATAVFDLDLEPQPGEGPDTEAHNGGNDQLE